MGEHMLRLLIADDEMIERKERILDPFTSR